MAFLKRLEKSGILHFKAITPKALEKTWSKYSILPWFQGDHLQQYWHKGMQETFFTNVVDICWQNVLLGFSSKPSNCRNQEVHNSEPNSFLWRTKALKNCLWRCQPQDNFSWRSVLGRFYVKQEVKTMLCRRSTVEFCLFTWFASEKGLRSRVYYTVEFS